MAQVNGLAFTDDRMSSSNFAINQFSDIFTQILTLVPQGPLVFQSTKGLFLAGIYELPNDY
jgi:hypothetical protein